MKLHWESWLLRLGLLGTLAFQLITHNTAGAMVAAEGFLVSLLPIAIEKLSKTHVPRPLEFAFVLGMALQFFSESTKLFELFYYWDKIVHPTLVALTALIAVWLLLGVPQLVMFLGAAFTTKTGMRGVWNELGDLLPGWGYSLLWAALFTGIGLLVASLTGKRADWLDFSATVSAALEGRPCPSPA